MSFNKFMHPRNKYQVPPDFKQLAIEYPEFRKHLFPDLSGKLKFNFQDPNALRIFTKTLLHKDFGLDVEIPASRLVPTLPLRLNYILWIEDLLKLNDVHSPVNGIDIGTGASCIYPLLACKKNSWNMLALENDPLSSECAQKNVDQNNLQDFIKVNNTSSSMSTPHCLEAWLEHDVTYHFTMCNPPFFASSSNIARTSHPRQKLGVPAGRPPPPNAHTGAETELVAPGGEVAFVKNIVEANIHLQQIKIFTTMLGHKSSLITLKKFLTQHPLVKQISCTEFCQGNTMRWGIAWTAHEGIKLPCESKRVGGSSKGKPLLHVMDGSDTSVEELMGRIVALCDSLTIIYKVLQKQPNRCKLSITAWENTWSKQRRRNRQNLQRDVHYAKSDLNIIDGLANNTKSTNIEEIDEKVFVVKSNDVEGQEDTTSNFQKIDTKQNKIDATKNNSQRNNAKKNDFKVVESIQNHLCETDYDMKNIGTEKYTSQEMSAINSIHEIVAKNCSQNNDRSSLKRNCDTQAEHFESKKIKKDLDIESNKKEPTCDQDVANGETLCQTLELNDKTSSDYSMKSTSKSDLIGTENATKCNLPSNEKYQINGDTSICDSETTKNSNQNVGGNSKSDKQVNEKSSDVPLVVCNLLIEELHGTPDGDKIAIEMIWVSGSGSRDLPHQILQYFKNHL